MKGFATKAIHGSLNSIKDSHKALRTAIYDNVAFEFDKAIDMQKAFEGRRLAHSYSRISNPTVAEFENRIKMLSDAQGVIAVSSGMAAIANVIIALAGSDTHLVTSNYLFGNTYSLFEQTLKPWGLSVSYTDMTNPAKIEAAIHEKTALIFFETITNPQLQVADIRAVVEIGNKHGIPVVVDGTMTTAVLCKTHDYGAAVEVLSSTKAISGGATSVGGLIIDNGTFDWSKNRKLKPLAKQCGPMAFLTSLRREIYRNLGSCLSPHNAYLQMLGLETMELRMRKSCDNALHIAQWLEESEKVEKVNYPGLENSPYHNPAKMQLSGGFGSVLTFNLHSREACFAVLDNCNVIRRATNIHDNKTLMLHPSSTIYCEYPAKDKEKMGVSDNMLRLSVGIENHEDIIDDLANALESI